MYNEILERKLIREFLYKNIIKKLNENTSSNNNNYIQLYNKISNEIDGVFVNSFFNTLKNLIKKINNKNVYNEINKNSDIKFITEELGDTLKQQEDIFAIPFYKNMTNNFGKTIQNAINMKLKGNDPSSLLKNLFSDFENSGEFKFIIAFKVKRESNHFSLDGKAKLFIILGEDKKAKITEMLQNKLLQNRMEGVYFDLDDKAKDVGKKVKDVVDNDELTDEISDEKIFESKKLLIKGELLLESLMTEGLLGFLMDLIFGLFIGTVKRPFAIVGQWVARYSSGEIIRAINRGWFLASKEHIIKLKGLTPSLKITDSSLTTQKDDLIKMIDNILSLETVFNSNRVNYTTEFKTAMNVLKSKINKGDKVSDILKALEDMNKNYKKIGYRHQKPANIGGKMDPHRTFYGKNADEIKGAEHFISGEWGDGLGKTFNRLSYIKDIFANGRPYDWLYYFQVFVFYSLFSDRLFSDDDITIPENNPTLLSFIDSIIKSDRLYVYSGDKFQLEDFTSQYLSSMNNTLNNITSKNNIQQQQIQTTQKIQNNNQSQQQPKKQQSSTRFDDALKIINNNQNQQQPKKQQIQATEKIQNNDQNQQQPKKLQRSTRFDDALKIINKNNGK